jgi:phage N-6-adenine-methyltransferase
MTLAISTNSFQAWRTPKHIHEALANDFGQFDLDAAADLDNAIAGAFLSEAANALTLTTRWEADCVWCNPPYKKILPWVERARLAVSRTEAKRVVMLLPAQVSSKWFTVAVTHGEVQTYQGRICFDLPPGMPNARRPAIANLVVIFGTHRRGLTGIRSAKTGALIETLV